MSTEDLHDVASERHWTSGSAFHWSDKCYFRDKTLLKPLSLHPWLWTNYTTVKQSLPSKHVHCPYIFIKYRLIRIIKNYIATILWIKIRRSTNLMQLTNTSRTCTFSFYIYNNRYRQDIKIQPDNNNTGETEERGREKTTERQCHRWRPFYWRVVISFWICL